MDTWKKTSRRALRRTMTNKVSLVSDTVITYSHFLPRGHSHVNRYVKIDGVSYLNNAFGYPSETRITSKRLMCTREC